MNLLESLGVLWVLLLIYGVFVHILCIVSMFKVCSIKKIIELWMIKDLQYKYNRLLGVENWEKVIGEEFEKENEKRFEVKNKEK